MSTKTLKKELMAAVAMMLVAVIALSGSTFAWFANNTVVEATGAEVVAETSKNLAISLTENGEYKTSVDFAADHTTKTTFSAVTVADSKEGTPVASIGAKSTKTTVTKGVEFYGLNTANNKVLNPGDEAATTTMAIAITNNDVANCFEKATANYWEDEVFLLYTAGAGSSIGATGSAIITVTTKQGIDLAFHIGLLTADNEWTNVELSDATQATVTEGSEYTYTVDIPEFVTLTANAKKNVKIYMWYEGEDAECFSNNAIINNPMSIALSFGIN